MRHTELRNAANWHRLSPTYRKHIERRINTDLLIKEIEICRFRVRIEHALVQIERNRRMAEPKNPKLRGLISGVARFRHDIDRDIEEAEVALRGAHRRREEVFTKVHGHIGGQVADLGEIGTHFDDLEAAIGDNGAPPSDGDSQESPKDSETSTDGEGSAQT
jgi:hypothetical protein